MGYPRWREEWRAVRAAETLSISCEDICTELHDLKAIMKGSTSCVAFPGAKPSIDECEILIVADSAIREISVSDYPDLTIVVSDGDGGLDKISRAVQAGAILIPHFHGDNPWLPPSLEGRGFRVRLATSQVVLPHGTGLLAPFGFTDGDRACLLPMALQARKIRCAIDLARIHHKGDPSSKKMKVKLFHRLTRYYAQALGYDCYGKPTI